MDVGTRSQLVSIATGRWRLAVGDVDGVAIERLLEAAAHPAQPRHPPSLAQLGHFRPTLIGRDGLVRKLANAALPGSVTVVAGAEGVGKTDVLLDAGRELEDRYADGVVYLSARTLGLEETVLILWEHLRAGSHVPTTAEALADLAPASALVLVDDCGEAGELHAALAAALPAAAVLIVSSDQRVGEAEVVPPLDDRAAQALWDRELARPGEAAGEELLPLLQGNPRMIVQAAAIARDSELSPSQLARRISSSGSHRALAEIALERLSPGERLALLALAVVGDGGASVSGLAASLSATTEQASRAAESLTRSGLAERVGVRYRLPAGLRGVVDDALSGVEEAEAVLDRASTFIAALEGDVGALLEEAATALGIGEWAARQADRRGVITATRATKDALAIYGRWASWEKTLQTLLGAARHHGQEPVVAGALHDLGIRSLVAGNDARAAEFLQEAAAIRSRLGLHDAAAKSRDALTQLRSAPPPAGGATQGPVEGHGVQPPPRLPLGRALAIALGGIVLGAGAGYVAASGDTPPPPATVTVTAKGAAIPVAQSPPVVRAGAAPKVGDTLTLQRARWAGARQIKDVWQRCDGSVCSAAQSGGQTYTVQGEDLGKGIRVTEIAIGQGGKLSQIAVSPEVFIQIPGTVAPATDGSLVINPTDNLTAGNPLTVTRLPWSNAQSPTTIVWQRCSAAECTPVTGADTTYAISPDDEGNGIRAVEIAKSLDGKISQMSVSPEVFIPFPPVQ